VQARGHEQTATSEAVRAGHQAVTKRKKNATELQSTARDIVTGGAYLRKTVLARLPQRVAARNVRQSSKEHKVIKDQAMPWQSGHLLLPFVASRRRQTRILMVATM
jgi:hypothetical protein